MLRITAEGHAAHDKSRLRAGDVVAVRSSGSVERTGDAAVVPPELDGANCIDLLIIRPNAQLRPQYVCEYLNAASTRAELVGRSSGTMQKHLNVGAVKKLALPVTSIREQDDVLDKLAAVDLSIDSIWERRTEVRAQARAALRLMAGMQR